MSKHARETSKSLPVVSKILLSALEPEKSATNNAREFSDEEITDEQIDKTIDQEIYEDDDEEMTSFTQIRDNEDFDGCPESVSSKNIREIQVNEMIINVLDEETAHMHTEEGLDASPKVFETKENRVKIESSNQIENIFLWFL